MPIRKDIPGHPSPASPGARPQPPVWARPQAKKARPVLQPYKPAIRRVFSAPSRLWYMLAVVVLLAGTALFAAQVLTTTAGITDNLTQVILPGRWDLTLTPGRYIIFHEPQSVVNGRTYSSSVVGVNLALKSRTSGMDVPLAAPTSRSEYAVGGRSGTAFLEFAIDQHGVYQLTGAYPRGRKGPEVVVAVGQGLMTDVSQSIASELPTLFGAIAIAALIAAAVYTLRRRAHASAR